MARSRLWMAMVAAFAVFAMVGVSLVLGPVTGASAADPCGPGSNPISCENSKPGADPAIWDVTGAGESDIQGFSTDISVNVGQTMGFKIKTDAADYTIDIYRTGWYQGLGARKITSIDPSAALPQIQPECLSDIETQLYDCGTWGLSASWAVPANAVSGVYIALLTRKDNGNASHVTFIVRDDSSHAKVVFQTSDPTWQAYNSYGGADFYQGASIGRAFKISYNRPVVTRGDVGGRDAYFASEYAMVRFLEQNGYDTTYISGVDTDRHGTLLKNHKVFLSVGHDEYWSGAQRANISAAADAGVNLQFLSGNDDYWRTRYEPSTTDNTDYRTITSYKETWSNAKIDPSPEWTGTWRDPRFASAANGGGMPENALSGTIYMANYTDLPVTVSAAEGKTRLWRNTTLTSMAAGTKQALAPHTVGYESNEDLDNGFRPAGLIRLSTTVGETPQYLQDYGNAVLPGTTTHNITLYKNPSGALIFSAGSVQWSWGLDQTHDGNGAPADPRMRQAQVNLLADMGAQPATLDPALVAASASTDTTAPVVSVASPANGTTVANGDNVTLSGTATDSGGVVSGVEVSTNGGTSWHPATGTGNWSYSYVQHGKGARNILVRGIDDSANYPATPTAVQLQVDGPYSVFGNEVPATIDSQDAGNTVLGLRFTPTENGYISGVRFYKSAANTGIHTGKVWDAAGTELATLAFANESSSGWQSSRFVTPVKVTAGESYVVSYNAPNGRYSYATGYWDYKGMDSVPLTAAGGFGAAPAGVYNTNSSFPTDSFENSNYFVDAIFESTDTSPLTAVGQVPVDGAGSVAVSSAVSAVLSKDVVPSSVGIVLKTAAGVSVAGSTSFDPVSRVASFVPGAALAESTKFVATLSATAVGGGALIAGGSWSFGTVKPDSVGCPCGLYQDSAVPSVLSIADGTALSLGVKFSASSNGTITGVKFYKGPGNTGTHTGYLYKADGSVLASVVFTGETTTGWQIATFATPVEVTGGAEYTAAYSNAVGTYSSTPGEYGANVTVGPLHVSAGSAVYSYGSNYPVNGSSASYLVDVVFEPAVMPLSATGQVPADGAGSVPVSTAVSAVLSKDAVPSSVGIVLKTAAGVSVAGSTSYNAVTRVASFAPGAALAKSTKYVATLSAATGDGEALAAGGSWSFGTVKPDSVDCPCGLYQDSAVPSVLSIADGTPLSLGVKFSAASDGTVTGVKFYKGPGNTGTHTGYLYKADGSVLASAAFTGETTTGWQIATFSTPVAVTGGAEYTAAYSNPVGTYSANPGEYGGDVAVGPLRVSAGSAVYSYGSNYPVNGSSASYLVDVVFEPAVMPLSATGQVPVDGAGSVAVSSAVSAVLSKDVVPSSVGIVLKTAAGVSVAGSTSFDPVSRVASFVPGAALAESTKFVATLSATAVGGGALTAGGSWSFGTVKPDSVGCPCGLYQDSAVPSVLSIADGTALSLGVKFSASSNGTITGVKFYKGPGNTGTHTGYLYKADGSVLASVVFTGETTTGWQIATFATPVEVTGGAEYTAAYSNAVGTYSSTPGEYGANVTVGPLHVSAGSAVYSYGSNYPVNGSSASYLVDVVFEPAAPPLAVTSRSPVPGAMGQPADVLVKATFSEPLAAGFTATLKDGATVLSGTTTLSPDSKTITFSPASALPSGATISVVLASLVSTQGAELADVDWQFGTVGESSAPGSQSMFGALVPETLSNSGDSAAIELGVAFTPASSGTVTAIRFFKGVGNTGVHTGSIWNDSGVRLATVQFAGETLNGWQSATLATPLDLAADTTYTVSYYAPNGRYSSTVAFFAAPFSKGQLSVAAGNNGKYFYGTGGGMPINSWNSTNYFVDVLFTPAEP
ncbi:DUF4082 domain-containing protein [Arthrobacter sp. H35-D1]|uniref:DUF4082 domain-containing protein n=1 Tax=Arthrobacter sp. H35-D1 TaxID=3046202 RepID=UPI0024B981CB|nr:DUF4082 domain-containing protein [Arthrobacter sp. H35-D1]MDJ0314513.1 DUF4082 domain-containing protein [Arthrobacter sp. H35-D1]